MKFELGSVHVRTRNRLPHWDAQHAIYFLTFNLFDALPRSEQQRIREEADAQAALIHGVRGDLTEAEKTALQQWVNSKLGDVLDHEHGSCFMRDREVARIVAEAITYFDEERYRLLAWCVMPSHVHVVCALSDKLDAVLHSWKSFTAKAANRVLGRTGSFWQDGSYDRCVRDSEELTRTIDYVLANPAKAGLIDWPFVRAYPERIASLISPSVPLALPR